MVIHAECDAVTGVAIILIGASIGVLGSTVNPFVTIIASDAAAVPFTNGIILRFVFLAGGLAICIAYVMRYASRVKADSARSAVSSVSDACSQVLASYLCRVPPHLSEFNPLN